MKLDLLALAKRIEEDYYKDVDCSFGAVRVYHTPEPMIWTYKPDRPAPIEPVVKMKTATGSQNRAIKASDKGYDEWRKDNEAYEDELMDIRLSARYVLALRDIEYPDLAKAPPLFNELGKEWPHWELLQKKTWLDFSVLALASDMVLIQAAMMELAGSTSADSVEEIKKSSESDSEGDQSGSNNIAKAEA